MTLRKIIEISDSHQLVISLPKGFHKKRMVLVTIDELPESRSQKMDEMLAASEDPLYLTDMVEVNNDFDQLAGEDEPD